MNAQVLRRGQLSDADKEQIRELASKGLGPTKIAKQIGRHPSTVNWFTYVEGLRAPTPSPDYPKSYLRNGRRVHRFTREEDEFIERHRADGLTVGEIARAASSRFGTERTGHAISLRLTMLAAREVNEDA